jgi:hypothetical protein
MVAARVERFVIIVLFLAVLLVPGLGLAIGVDSASVSEAEMRELSGFPSWSWTPGSIAAWPGRFRTYFEDRFTFRGRLLTWRTNFLWHRLGSPSSSTVFAGKDGWLFYAIDGGLEDYAQTEPATEAQLEVWRQMIDRTDRWLGARGIKYLFVIAPDKPMIYPEFTPASIVRLRDDFRMDQLISYLRTRSPVEILDLRPALLAAKSSELLYHRYDTHWNDRGGLVAARPIAKRLRDWFPAVPVLEREDFEEVPGVPSGDSTSMLGLVDTGKLAMPGLVPRGGWTHRVLEPQTPSPYSEDGRVVTAIPGSDLPRLLMFRDSFASRLVPYISEDFSHAVYLWRNDFDTWEVEQARPDVVIQEFVARHLITHVPYPASIPDP